MNKHIRKQMTNCTKNGINKETNQRTKIDAKLWKRDRLGWRRKWMERTQKEKKVSGTTIHHSPFTDKTKLADSDLGGCPVSVHITVNERVFMFS